MWGREIQRGVMAEGHSAQTHRVAYTQAHTHWMWYMWSNSGLGWALGGVRVKRGGSTQNLLSPTLSAPYTLFISLSLFVSLSLSLSPQLLSEHADVQPPPSSMTLAIHHWSKNMIKSIKIFNIFLLLSRFGFWWWFPLWIWFQVGKYPDLLSSESTKLLANLFYRPFV